MSYGKRLGSISPITVNDPNTSCASFASSILRSSIAVFWVQIYAASVFAHGVFVGRELARAWLRSAPASGRPTRPRFKLECSIHAFSFPLPLPVFLRSRFECLLPSLKFLLHPDTCIWLHVLCVSGSPSVADSHHDWFRTPRDWNGGTGLTAGVTGLENPLQL